MPNPSREYPRRCDWGFDWMDLETRRILWSSPLTSVAWSSRVSQPVEWWVVCCLCCELWIAAKGQIEGGWQDGQSKAHQVAHQRFQVPLIQQIRVHAGSVHRLGLTHSLRLRIGNIRSQKVAHQSHYVRLPLPEPVVGGHGVWPGMLIGPPAAGEFVKVLAGISLFVHRIDEAGRCADALLAPANWAGFLNWNSECGWIWGYSESIGECVPEK